MLYREIIAVCSEIHTKYINTLCGQNVELLNVKQVVHIVTIGLWRVNDADFTVYCCWLWALNAGTCDVYLLCNDYASDFHHTILRPTFRVTVFHPATHTLLPSPDPAAHPPMLARLLRYLAVRSLLVSCALAGAWRGCLCVGDCSISIAVGHVIRLSVSLLSFR